MDGKVNDGAFRHGHSLPNSVLPSLRDALRVSVIPQSHRPSDIRAQCMAEIIRHQHLRDMLSAIAEWSHSEGTERAYWRRNALADIATFRRRYLVPERQAFEAAVSQQHRRAA